MDWLPSANWVRQHKPGPNNLMSEYEVNARRLLCPMPVIRTQDAIANYSPGDIVHVLGTDPGIKADIPAWCRINGHQVTSVEEHDDEIEITIIVGED